VRLILHLTLKTNKIVYNEVDICKILKYTDMKIRYRVGRQT